MVQAKREGSAPRKSRPRGSGPTIAEVARLAGVSPMTVSRVINREGNVLPATQEKVRGAIETLGYVPNPAARHLAGGRQCRIVLLHSNPSSAYLSEFLMGSLAQASASHAQLVVEHCEETDTADALVARLGAHRVDAVLLPPPLCDDAALTGRLHELGLPMAQIATGDPLSFAHAVTIDDMAAARDMTRHLIELGHRRIGFITGHTNQTASALRQAGFEAALDEAGIAVERELIRQGDFSYRSGLDAAEALFALEPRPTAIFASNDDMAAAAVATAHRHGLGVPADISICGYDDTAMATTIWPELTTIRQPVAEMARAATGMLVDQVRARSGEEAGPQHRQLDYALIHRASDGPPNVSG
jgi:LacI family transcriptional regulator